MTTYPFFRYLRTLDALGFVRSELKSQELFLRNAFDLMRHGVGANPDNHFWYTLFVPSEIMHASGAVAIESDTMGVYLSAFGYLKRLMAYAEQQLGLVEICSYHKALMSALHLEILPPPRAIVVNGNCCDTARKLGNYVQRNFGSELFIIDTPAQRTPAAVAYLRGQLIELSRFLARVSGRPFDIDRLREVVRLSNEATRWWKMALDLRQGPPLLRGIGVQSRFLNMPSIFGTPRALEVARLHYEELLERRQRGEPKVPAGCRLMWLHHLPLYKSLFDEVEELGASVVVELLAYPYWDRLDEADPFAALAERLLTHPVTTTNDTKGQYVRALAERFRVDGTIQLMHGNCRGNYGLSRCAADGLRGARIPMLQVEMDALDFRAYAPEQLRTRVQGFIESLAMRAPGGAAAEGPEAAPGSDLVRLSSPHAPHPPRPAG